MSFEADLRASWCCNAPLWTEIVRTGGIATRVRVTDAAILRAALAGRPQKALDLGCGEGWLCRALMAGGVADVTGIDATPALVDAARAHRGRYLRLDYAEIARDPTQVGDGFDLVVANFALLDAEVAPLLGALARIAAPGGRLLIQTLHPMNAEAPYEDGWRTETFGGFGDTQTCSGWAPMPWYFRTMGSWLACLAPGWALTRLAEPLHPETRRAASLILEARAVADADRER